MQPHDVRRGPARDRDVYEHEHDDYDDYDHDERNTPPFGVGASPGSAADQETDPGRPSPPADAPAKAAAAFEIRDRLIELDDLRRRGILSEEEFAAKKSELLNRI
jgi:hypothetical protein